MKRAAVGAECKADRYSTGRAHDVERKHEQAVHKSLWRCWARYWIDSWTRVHSEVIHARPQSIGVHAEGHGIDVLRTVLHMVLPTELQLYIKLQSFVFYCQF